jgi:peptide/nickel transport system permease protein
MRPEPVPALAALTEAMPVPGGGIWRNLRGRPGLLLGLLGLALIVAMAIFAPLFTQYDPYRQDLLHRRLPPIWHAWIWGDDTATAAHLLGTDKVGRDYWTRLVFGARVSLIVGFTTAVVSGAIGTAIGITAGYWGGRIDMAASFLIQSRLAMPIILVALAAVSIFGASLPVIILVASLLLWDRAAVVTRTTTQQIRQRDFVLTEILPNLSGALGVILTIEMGNAILLEAALSFLGLGIRPPAPSWGLMLAEAKEDIFFAPWAITIPGTALFLLVLSVSLVGDGLQGIRRTDRQG